MRVIRSLMLPFATFQSLRSLLHTIGTELLSAPSARRVEEVSPSVCGPMPKTHQFEVMLIAIVIIVVMIFLPEVAVVLTTPTST